VREKVPLEEGGRAPHLEPARPGGPFELYPRVMAAEKSWGSGGKGGRIRFWGGSLASKIY